MFSTGVIVNENVSERSEATGSDTGEHLEGCQVEKRRRTRRIRALGHRRVQQAHTHCTIIFHLFTSLAYPICSTLSLVAYLISLGKK